MSLDKNLIYYVGIFILFFVILIFISSKDKSKISTKTIIYSAICMALAYVLSLFSIYEMPQGGSVHFCSMLFLSLIGYWFGIKVGIVSCTTYGVLNLLKTRFIVHPLQVLLDYILGFGVFGVSGLFRNKKYGLYIGYILGSFLRLLSSTISGAVFFRAYCPHTSYWTYSIIYNMSYVLPEMIITLIIIFIPTVKNAINRLHPNHSK